MRRVHDHGAALLRGIGRFVEGARAVDGVLAWWPKFEWALGPAELLRRPHEVLLITRNSISVGEGFFWKPVGGAWGFDGKDHPNSFVDGVAARPEMRKTIFVATTS